MEDMIIFYKEKAAVVIMLLILIFASSCVPQKSIVEESQSKEFIEESQAKEKENIGFDVSYMEDAQIYLTVEELVRDSDIIFEGKLNALEKVEGTTWFWELYTVQKWYKGFERPEIIRVVGQGTTVNDEMREIGSSYLVFATVYENVIYPYPLVNPIHGQAVLELSGENQVSAASIQDKDMFPVVFESDFLDNLHSLNTTHPELFEAAPFRDVVSRYGSVREMFEYSDLVIRVSFDEIEEVNQYAKMGHFDAIELLHQSKAPSYELLGESIVVNSDIQVGREYIIFMKLWGTDDLSLAAREGAIISENDAALWDEALSLSSEQE